MSFIYYLSSKKMLSEREKVLKRKLTERDKFQRKVSVLCVEKPPLNIQRINPTQVGDPDYLRRVDQTFQTSGCMVGLLLTVSAKAR